MGAETELLDIGQAAAFLGVSEMSLRRWTNAGLLACFRIGGRRERRFRRADLVAFLERGATPGPDARAALAAAPAHFCGLYTETEERERQIADFLVDGLVEESTCLLVGEEALCARVLGRLRRTRPALRRERLVVSRYATTVAGQLEYWESRFRAETRKGATSLRVVGDVSGGRLARRGSFADVLGYETAYRMLAERFPLTTLCLYDARRLSGVETAGLLRLHEAVYPGPRVARG